MRFCTLSFVIQTLVRNQQDLRIISCSLPILNKYYINVIFSPLHTSVIYLKLNCKIASTEKEIHHCDGGT